MAKRKLTIRNYSSLVGNISSLLTEARKTSAIAVNAILTATYWEIGRKIVEYEYKGMERVEYYGEKLLENLSKDLRMKFGRGFSRQNIQLMKQFYEVYPIEKICQTPSGKSRGYSIPKTLPSKFSKHLNIRQTLSGKSSKGKVHAHAAQSSLNILAESFPLPWSHYVRLFTVKNDEARLFYEAEALQNGWSVRQLDRQISSQFYERTLLSKNKAAMLKKGRKALAEDLVTPEEEFKDPFVLEFLALKDEYSESDLEEALILHLEQFLLELGGDFAFVGRQKRLRIGNVWFKVDLIFFHRKLKCLVIIDLKVGKFTHEDAGQMHLYLNFARENWIKVDENPPVGIILCAEKDSAIAKYSLEGLPNKVLTAEYKLVLPNEKLLANEVAQTKKLLERRRSIKIKNRR